MTTTAKEMVALTKHSRVVNETVCEILKHCKREAKSGKGYAFRFVEDALFNDVKTTLTELGYAVTHGSSNKEEIHGDPHHSMVITWEKSGSQSA